VEDMTAKILTKLRITMLQHLIIKKNVLDNRKKLEKYGQEEAFRVGVIEQIENDVREIEGEIQRKREELGPLEERIREYSGSYNNLQVKYDTITLMIKEAQRDVTFLSKDREKKNQERVRLDGEKNSLVQISENQKDVIERVKSINEALNKEK
jgi:chromosome segregation ATPase